MPLSKDESEKLSNEVTQTMASGLTSRDLLIALLAIIATDRYTVGGTPTEKPEPGPEPKDRPGRKDDKPSAPGRSVFPPR